MRWRSGRRLSSPTSVAQVVGAHDLLVRVGAGVAQHRRVELEVGGAHRAAQDVERAVAHDREEPGLERHLAAVGAQRGQRADEGVLDDLLGVVVRAAEHLARVADAAAARSARGSRRRRGRRPRARGRRAARRWRPGRRWGEGGSSWLQVRARTGSRSQPPEGHTWPPEVGHPSPWVALTVHMPSPLQAHSATPAELRERIEAERRGRPFLVLRDGDGAQRLLDLAALRARQHRPRQRQRAEPAVGHGGLAPARRARGASRASGRSATTASRATAPTSTARASPGRTRLRDGDVLRVGQTSMAYRRPESEDSHADPDRRPAAHARRPAADPAPGPRRARAALQARRVRRARRPTRRSPTSCTSASTRSSRTCARCSSASASSTCPRTRSARGWWPRRCRPASSRRATSRAVVSRWTLPSPGLVTHTSLAERCRRRRGCARPSIGSPAGSLVLRVDARDRGRRSSWRPTRRRAPTAIPLGPRPTGMVRVFSEPAVDAGHRVVAVVGHPHRAARRRRSRTASRRRRSGAACRSRCPGA